MMTPPVLSVFCGKIASGKSTLSAEMAKARGTVLISEDAWLKTLYGPDELNTGAAYLRYSTRLQAAMAPHVTDLLKTGLSVVLDFPANTPAQRQWMRAAAEAAGVRATLYVLDVPDAVCLERLRARNAGGTHAFTVSEAQFHQFAAHFQPPADAEGFEIVRPASGA